MSNPRMDQNENDRRMSGVVGMGKIVEVRLSDHRARVRDGEIVTGWLRMGMGRAFGDVQSWPYAEGEEVGYATISGDMQDGFIFCALPNGSAPANAAPGVLRAKAGGGFELTGDVIVTGNVTVNGGIKTTRDVVAAEISLQKHIHIGDSAGLTKVPQ